MKITFTQLNLRKAHIMPRAIRCTYIFLFTKFFFNADKLGKYGQIVLVIMLPTIQLFTGTTRMLT